MYSRIILVPSICIPALFFTRRISFHYMSILVLYFVIIFTVVENKQAGRRADAPPTFCSNVLLTTFENGKKQSALNLKVTNI